jgi:hypothetical protein
VVAEIQAAGLYFEKKANRIFEGGSARLEPKFANLTQYAWLMALAWTRHLPTYKPSQDTGTESFTELSSIDA